MSFSTQCLNWIDMCRAARGQQTSNQGHNGEKERSRAEQRWALRGDIIQLRGD